MQINDREHRRLVRIERATRALFKRFPLRELLELEDGQGQSLAAPVKRLIGALDAKPRQAESVAQCAPGENSTSISALHDVARGEVLDVDDRLAFEPLVRQRVTVRFRYAGELPSVIQATDDDDPAGC